MTRARPKRRWLQFSLRSVLLLTLVVALWLGCEVREARHVTRTIAALRALGGTVETESTGPSLLRIGGVPGYGQRIVRVEVPGAAAEEAIPLLSGLSELRELDVIYDGTFDPTLSWAALRRSLSAVAMAPRCLEEEGPLDEALLMDDGRWKRSSASRRLMRIRARLFEAYPKKIQVDRFPVSYDDYSFGHRTRYRPLLLADGTLAELLTCEQMRGMTPGSQHCFAVLIVADKCAGVREFAVGSQTASQRIVLEDLDKDGFADVGFEVRGNRLYRKGFTRQLMGDSRTWLGVYKIERDGFKSLLPEDGRN